MQSTFPRGRQAVIGLAGLLAGALVCQAALAAPKGSPEHIAAVTARIDEQAIRANASRTADWPAYGLDYAETRHSKLTGIDGNAKWYSVK